MNINTNRNITFGQLYATKNGAYKLVDSFQDKNFLESLVKHSQENISADVIVNDDEIRVTPNKITQKRPLKLRCLNKDFGYTYPDSYIVDFFAYDIYPEAKNAYYPIKNYKIPNFPKYSTDKKISEFGKLFVAACHIAADIDCSFHNEITKTIEKEKELGKIIKELGINIVDGEL